MCAQVRGIIIHGGITSGLRIIRPVVRKLPHPSGADGRTCSQPRTYFFDIFPNIDLIKKSSSPVLIIHGRLDEEVPIINGVKYV
jgi:hypothetical protein